jgi:hypothetical protein
VVGNADLIGKTETTNFTNPTNGQSVEEWIHFFTCQVNAKLLIFRVFCVFRGENFLHFAALLGTGGDQA